MSITSRLFVSLTGPPIKSATYSEAPAKVPASIPNPIKRLCGLPVSLLRMHRLIKHELTPDTLNQNLFALWGFHHLNEVPHYRMRTWESAPPRDMAPDQILWMSAVEFVGLMRVAMEIELPIHRYSEQSGKSLGDFWNLMSQYMGRTEEEQTAYINGLGGKAEKCRPNGGWCAEENRHGNMFMRMIDALTGEKPDLSNSHDFNEAFKTEEGAIKHVYDRMGTEWGAPAAYFALAAHSRGPLRQGVMNILRDEIKHLTIFSSAGVYLHGHRPWYRLARMGIRILREYNFNRKKRSGGSQVGTDPFLVPEMLFALYMIERQMQGYLKTLPMQALVKIFETPSKIPALAEIPLDEDSLAERTARRDDFENKKRDLGYWTPWQRQRELKKREFEKLFYDPIQKIIQKEFNGFESTERVASAGFNQTLMDIDSLTLDYVHEHYFSDVPAAPHNGKHMSKNGFLRQLKEILKDRLRQHLIENNDFERLRKAGTK